MRMLRAGCPSQMDHLPFWEMPTKGGGAGFGQGTSDIIEYVATLKAGAYNQRVSGAGKVGLVACFLAHADNLAWVTALHDHSCMREL